MEIETTAGALRSALKLMRGLIKKRATIPVLGMVKLADGAVSGTDLDIVLSVKMPASRFVGAGLVPFAPLDALSRGFDDGQTVTLKSADGYAVVLESGQSRYVLPGLPVDDFPELSMPEDLKPVRVSGEKLKDAVSFVKPYISEEETRYYLNGVAIRDCEVVATDGHRLGLAEGVLEEPVDETLILHKNLVALLVKLPPCTSVLYRDCRLKLEAPGVTVCSKLIDGTYPDFRRVIPTGVMRMLQFDRAAACASLRRLKAVGGPARKPVGIASNGKTLVFAATDSCGETGLEAMACTGEAMSVEFNIAYLSGALRMMDGEDVIFLRNGEKGSPIRLDCGQRRTIVIMPMLESKTGQIAREALDDTRVDDRPQLAKAQ